MFAVFRVSSKTILLSPERTAIVKLTYVYLHDFLMKSKKSRYAYMSYVVFGEDKEGYTIYLFIPGKRCHENENTNCVIFLSIRKVRRKHSVYYETNRNEFAEYFIGEGSKPVKYMCIKMR